MENVKVMTISLFWRRSRLANIRSHVVTPETRCAPAACSNLKSEISNRKSLFMILALVLASPTSATHSFAQGVSPAKPNVVFILADDLGWGEVGCFGQTKIPTPNIDRIAAKGMRLTQHYSGAPVCAPSRCVLMTGKHLGHAEINPQPKPGHINEVTGEVNANDYFGKTYAPNVIADEAVRFIDEHKSQPFFLYFTPIEPHVAIHPPQAAVDRFPKEWDSKQYHGESGYLPNPRPRAAYAAMINDLDSTAGLRGFKGSVYEGGLRVPTVVRFPGKITAGTGSDAPGYFADWFPTICDACGIAPPAALDGENLWPVLCGKSATSPRKPMVWVFPEYGGQVAVRIGDHKIIRRNLNKP